MHLTGWADFEPVPLAINGAYFGGVFSGLVRADTVTVGSQRENERALTG